MSLLRTLEGKGRLIAGTGDGPATYLIRVWRDPGGLKSGQGSLQADDRLLLAAFNNDNAKLELEGGGSIKILISEFRPGTGECEFALSGPLPEAQADDA